MKHEHGSEYRLKVVLRDGNENLSAWLDQEQLSLAMAAALAGRKAFWLQERKLVCLNCAEREPDILEYPVAATESPRCAPHDSRYLMAAGVRNRGEVSRFR